MTAVAAEAAVAGALRRAALHGLLAAAFAYPMGERVRDLARRARAVPAGPGAAGLGAALGRLATAAEEADAAALAGQYVELFDRAVRCPPYEGAWGPQQISGKAALLADVAGFYTAFGVAPAAQHADIEDHVGAELEFMSVLALKEAHAVAEGKPDAVAVTREAQATFLAEHLGRWGEAFAARVQAVAPPGFYPAAAVLLAGWIEEECAALAVRPTTVDTVASADAAPFTCPMAVPEATAAG